MRQALKQLCLICSIIKRKKWEFQHGTGNYKKNKTEIIELEKGMTSIKNTEENLTSSQIQLKRDLAY